MKRVTGSHKNGKCMWGGRERWRKRIGERSRGVERERGGCGDNRRIDSTRDTPGCFRGLNGSSTTFDNFDNANYKTTVHATTSSGSSSENCVPAEESCTRTIVASRVFWIIHRYWYVAMWRRNARILLCYFLICPRSPPLRFHTKIFKKYHPSPGDVLNQCFYF